MLQIHEAVAVISHAYSERLADQGKNLIQLHEALGFAVADLPKREQ